MDGGRGTTIERALPEALRDIQRLTGFPVVFGGRTRTVAASFQLEITRLIGTLGTSLRGLRVSSGRGLGGAVLRDGAPHCVNDYAGTDRITHDYDDIVVRDERITSVMAMPIVVNGAVEAVLYGAVRDGRPIGERAMRAAGIVAARVQREAMACRETDVRPPASALDELADIIQDIDDERVRARLLRVHAELSGKASSPGARRLSEREREALRLVATGASNLEIAVELRLSPETVKAYLRSAMRKLDVHNRTAAVHAARLSGAL
ncbi:LuxR C-terminal-related transcriptional regulator [Rhizohabitans arisaemae]|uniref:LuxR C-terminal-related transcriptional regulator n=1 Tax=Rhizohabitans arisaemae TaxID=2720610 RepID=UPI0024B046C2|nr:LuxR C-terminal-related transcriptional regulator [Rhizohabitans arisaemae]